MMYAGLLLVGAAGAVALWGFRRRVRGLPHSAILLAIILPATLMVVSLISLQTNQNYFSLTQYPWGDLLLIATFSVIPAIAVPCADCWRGNFIADLLRILLMLLAISRIAVFVTGQAYQGYQQSELSLKAYRAAGQASGPFFDTGLSLDKIPMEEQPLPTANSPAWFIADYNAFFLKYYGYKTTLLFK